MLPIATLSPCAPLWPPHDMRHPMRYPTLLCPTLPYPAPSYPALSYPALPYYAHSKPLPSYNPKCPILCRILQPCTRICYTDIAYKQVAPITSAPQSPSPLLFWVLTRLAPVGSDPAWGWFAFLRVHLLPHLVLAWGGQRHRYAGDCQHLHHGPNRNRNPKPVAILEPVKTPISWLESCPDQVQLRLAAWYWGHAPLQA